MALPKHADIWCNGHVNVMIERGTYEDFREELLLNCYCTPEEIKKFDEVWDAVSDEEKARRRQATLDFVSPSLRASLVQGEFGKQVKRAEPTEPFAKAETAKMKREKQAQKIKEVFPDGYKRKKKVEDA